jgi:DNA repair exonuclease SbcCD ATPase subunit
MTIRKSPTYASAVSGHATDDLLHFDDAPEFMESASLDDVDHKVKAAQEQLLQLRMQQEEIERQKHQLETLRVKQERFVAGKRDLLEKLGRSVSHVERELYDTQKRVEELSLTQDDFRRHLDILKSLQPEKWHRSQVDEELDQALAAIQDAEADYSKGTRRLESLRSVEVVPVTSVMNHQMGSSEESISDQTMTLSSPTREMMIWMRRGFAFTLPLIGAMLVGLLLVKMMF